MHSHDDQFMIYESLCIHKQRSYPQPNELNKYLVCFYNYINLKLHVKYVLKNSWKK